jgi:hypothetical protein
MIDASGSSDGLDLLAVVTNTVVAPHLTAKGWPMIALLIGETSLILEPWECRQLANELQTFSEKLIRKADSAEKLRTVILG